MKAVSGGGGRGMRRVTDPAALPEAIEAASREAESAFGDPMVYLEQAVLNPRHIEVQILADRHGNVMHLFERDCSVQRRHQKVIELAPAPNLPEELRAKICADAVAFARQINYSYAGTVEFLLDERGHHVFIEMNPRIQVEHTVTEEITDVDLVASQMRIADGETLEALGLSQETLTVHGAAMQCRITTEDPANGFRPDTGRITGYRQPRRSGHPAGRRHQPGRGDQRAFRLDAGQTHLPRTRLLRRDRPGPARAGRVPDQGRFDEHPVPDGRRQRPRLPGGTGHHVVHRSAALSADRAHTCRPRHQDPQLPGRRDGEPAARPASVDGLSARQAAGDRPGDLAAAGQQAAADRDGPGGVRAVDARFDGRRCHRHHVPRRASVAAGDAAAHQRPADGGAVHRQDDAAAVVDRMLGRRDLRCGASVLEGRPVGAAGRAAGGGAQHLPADAAARAQHRRLHPVPGAGHQGVRRRGDRHRNRHLPHLRRAEQRRVDASRHRRGARNRYGDSRSRDELHR